MNRWRQIVESLPDAVIVLAPDLSPEASNPAAEALVGVSPVTRTHTARLIGQNPWLGSMLEACLSTGHSLDNPDGLLSLERRQVAVRVQVSPVLGRRGEVSGAIVQLCDLSYQRNLERVSEPAERVFQLSPAGLAHEIKNPLTGIKGAAELLAASAPDNPRLDQYCEVILHGVNRIASLVERVLDASRPPRLTLEPVNVHQPLQQALKLAGLFEPPNGIVVEQLFDPSLPPVEGDSAALEQVFLNLFRNAVEAIRASPEQAGRIAVRTAIETQFRLRAGGKRRPYLRVEVSDTGVGLSEQEMGQLFAPFFTTKAEGTGLGLMLSQKIVTIHGGRMWARRGARPHSEGLRTDPDRRFRGMTFCVILPLSGK